MALSDRKSTRLNSSQPFRGIGAGPYPENAGCLRAESLGLDTAHLTVLFGDDSDSGSLKAGALFWHDAWFIPANTAPFTLNCVP